MGQPAIQTSFNAGEWAPPLNARVDLQKYHSGAALLRNFFVDYRGGATTRPGTKYVLQARSAGTVRLIPFTASFTTTYILEFGQGYIRFYTNGAPVLENAKTITGASGGAPTVFTSAAHGYANNDWLFIGGNYYIVQNATTNTFTLTDLFGNAINANPFTLPTPAQRVYTLLTSPYQAADLFGIKYVQNVNTLILCHPNYPPQQLVITSATNWAISPINFGPTIATPTGLTVTTTNPGTNNVGYVVTAVDINGQESAPTVPFVVSIVSSGSNQSISWNAVSGAQSYNIYRSITIAIALPGGIQYGFIQNVTGTSFVDPGVTPNFAICAPIEENPFAGTGVATVTTTLPGSGYKAVPSVVFGAPPPGGVTATATCSLNLASVVITGFGAGYSIGSIISLGNGAFLTVTSTFNSAPFAGLIGSVVISNDGSILSGSAPTTFTDSGNTGGGRLPASFSLSWQVATVSLTAPGTGYLVAPSVTFTGGSPSVNATGSCTLGAASSGNPAVPGFIQQRLFLGGPVLAPSQFNMSQPGAPYNFNITNPVQPDNAIQETLTNTTLNTIKSVVAVSAGLIIFTDKGAWLLNGGSAGSAIDATALVANPQAYSGAGDLPPIVTPNDILYIQAKGSIVRDLAFNFYLNNYVGTDITILSSHLFYGFTLAQWAWAEEPFKLLWAVRNDGSLLSLTFIKEQELVAWAHSDTQGTYVSIASVNEQTLIGNTDAVYVVVQRNINGQQVNYIERMVELNYPANYKSSWQVDAGIGYNGAAATTFSGAQHLGGQAVTGLADGVVINFTMPVSGTFVFGPGGTAGLTGIANASIVTVGLSFLPQLQTLRLDLGEPTVQGKRKKIAALTTRCANALGLSCGRTFSSLTAMKDLVIGNVGTMSNQIVTGLVTDDARTIMDPLWDVPGQLCIQQSNPYPASVLGIIPEIEVGDTIR